MTEHALTVSDDDGNDTRVTISDTRVAPDGRAFADDVRDAIERAFEGEDVDVEPTFD